MRVFFGSFPHPATTRRNSMTRLSEPEKLEIVRLLAHFNRPAEVVVAMREHHGVEVDRFQVRTYDPTNSRYESGDKWREIFDAERSKHLESIEDIPIAHKAYRLNVMQKCLNRAERSGNIVLVLAILAQAAKETRGELSNRSQIDSQSEYASRDQSSPEERRNEFRDTLNIILGRARDSGALPQPAKASAA